MNRSAWVLFLAIFTIAIPSWGQSGSVIRDGKEWLQPADFTGHPVYTYDEVNEVCPEGICSGMLPGSSFDLSGYTWASLDEVNALFNSYGVSPPFTGPSDRFGQDAAVQLFFSDFIANIDGCVFGSSSPCLIASVRDRASEGSPPNGTMTSLVPPAFWDGIYHPQFAGVWFWRPSVPQANAIVLALNPLPNGRFDLAGIALDRNDEPACALAMASGRCVFTCGPGSGRCEGGTADLPLGEFELLDLTTEADGTITLQVFIQGHVSYTEQIDPSDFD